MHRVKAGGEIAVYGRKTTVRQSSNATWRTGFAGDPSRYFRKEPARFATGCRIAHSQRRANAIRLEISKALESRAREPR